MVHDWKADDIVEAVNTVARSMEGRALYSELEALGWWWGDSKESIAEAKTYADRSPHRARIRWLLSQLYDLELAELDRLSSEALPASGSAVRDTPAPVGVEGKHT